VVPAYARGRDNVALDLFGLGFKSGGKALTGLISHPAIAAFDSFNVERTAQTEIVDE
jgi:hypothetical protein